MLAAHDAPGVSLAQTRDELGASFPPASSRSQTTSFPGPAFPKALHGSFLPAPIALCWSSETPSWELAHVSKAALESGRRPAA